MNAENPQLRCLLRWNRFWLALVALCAVIGGFKWAEQRMISDASRLQLAWRGESLVFSSAGGGPFIVTHLVTQPGGKIDTATAAIAELPRPLFVRGPKARTDFSGREFAKLRWFGPDGEKVAAPQPGAPVQALFSTTQKVTATR